jgi:pyrimidine-specific ribonucleoside hydrolase
VPPEKQLEKFKGRYTCPTLNLNGDISSAFKALESAQIAKRFFVSKNVCHGVVYDEAIHQEVAAVKDKSLSLQLIYKGMDFSLIKNKEGKKLHDPLAACCALNPHIATWAEVELCRERGEWGARLKENTNTWIITDYNHAEFVKTFTQ